MAWKDVGYLSLSKKGKSVRIALKHTYYVLNLNDVKKVLDGSLNYALIYEHTQEPEQTKQT